MQKTVFYRCVGGRWTDDGPIRGLYNGCFIGTQRPNVAFGAYKAGRGAPACGVVLVLLFFFGRSFAKYGKHFDLKEETEIFSSIRYFKEDASSHKGQKKIGL